MFPLHVVTGSPINFLKSGWLIAVSHEKWQILAASASFCELNDPHTAR
jgi:hypothetical protein